MQIKIASRFKPYSHLPGAACLIPGTNCIIEAYPTLLRIGNQDVWLPLTGPIRNFTVEQDLEKNCVWIFGEAKEGYYRLQIVASEQGIEVLARRGSLPSFKIPLLLPFCLPPKWERLSLGNHKSQDWDLVWRRMDLREILPILFCLAQKTPGPLGNPIQDINFKAFCKARFSQMLIPREVDDQHQGLAVQLGSLQEIGATIRSLFFRQNGFHLQILPQKMFEAGRLIHIQALDIGELDLEWAKGMPRRISIRTVKSGQLFLQLPKGITKYRVRNSWQTIDSGEPLAIEAGKVYHLDRFQR